MTELVFVCQDYQQPRERSPSCFRVSGGGIWLQVRPNRIYIVGPLPFLNPTTPPSASMRLITSSNKIGV